VLEDWERREWADIERELSSDAVLVAKLAPPSPRELRRLRVRQLFCSGGWLFSFAYMVAAMSGPGACCWSSCRWS
jgi:hypothetical protein